VRESLPAVLRLAWSIHQHGLLENLVVIEQPSAKKRAEGVLYQLKAGSRRFEALRRLVAGVEAPPGTPDRENNVRWTWPRERTVPVLVLGSGGNWEHLVENLDRSDPLPWEIGRRVDEILSAGVSMETLGVRIGRSKGWVHRHAHIGRGLAPELIAVLRQERADVDLYELAQLASITDPYGDPDGQKQIETYRARRTRKRRQPRRMNQQGIRAVIKRLQYLRTDMPIPPLVRPIVDAVIAYLDGGGKPGFRNLESNLYDAVRRLSTASDGDTSEDSA